MKTHLVNFFGLLLRLHGVANQRTHHLVDISQRFSESFLLGCKLATAGSEGANFLTEQTNRTTAIFNNLAEEEVETLNRSCAFVQSINLGVTNILLERPILREARATKGL